MSIDTTNALITEKYKSDDRDPWKLRSRGMRCVTCMYWVKKIREDGEENPSLGRCRRHAPTMSGYPATFSNDWCGDHKLNENTI